MKMLFTKWAWACSALLFFGLFSLNTQNANAQILITEGFDATTTPTGWLYTGFSRVTSPNAPCEGLGSLRRNLWSSASAQTGSVAAPVWISNGENINVTFDFKLLNYQGTLSPANVGVVVPITNWGEMRLQLSTDGGTNYTTVFTINADNYTASTSCSEYMHTIDGSLVPDGSSTRIRLFGQWTAGDYYMYFDGVTIQQEGTFDCPLISANFGAPCDDGNIFTSGTTIDGNCDCTGGTIIVFEGCNTGTSYATLSPVCSGPQVNTASNAYTLEYSPVNIVDANINYQFFLSNPNYFVTVTNGDGTTILAYGQGSVDYIPLAAGSYRMYSHAGPDCPSTTGSATSHVRSILPGACNFDCPLLEANIGDACTLEGFFDTTVNGDCQCVGTPFDCNLGEGEYANFGDPCTLPGSGASYSDTVATQALGFPNTFAANPAYTVTVPAGLEGDYVLNLTAAGEVFGGSWRNEFRVQVLDPNGVNVTNGAPGGATDEWQPTSLSQGGEFEGSLMLSSIADPSGDWTVLVRLSFNEGPQVNANVDITLAFEPAPFQSTIGDDCACIAPEVPFGGCTTADFIYGNLVPACGETANSPSDAYTNELSLVTVVAGDDYVFSLSNPDYYVTVTDSNLVVLAAGQGSASLTASADDILLFFSHIDADCSTTGGFATSHTRSVTRTCNAIFDCPLIFANFGDACDDGDPNTIDSTIDGDCNCTGGTPITFEGCTTGSSFLTLSPVCSGPPVNANGSWTNEYSTVNVVDGESYTFSLSNPDYWVTVSLGDSIILAADQGIVEWTSDFTGSVRFYSHAGIDCPTTSGSATTHIRTVVAGACTFDCPTLEANIGDACSLEGFFDATVNANCECQGTPFDCNLGEGEYANFGDACIIPGSGDSYSQTVATEALGFPNTFEANPAYIISVPAGLTGDYQLTVTAAGEVVGGSWRSEFRVQILDPNGVNVTDGAPGGLSNEWQPSSLSGGGVFEGTLNLPSIADPSGDWTVLVRLSFNEGPQVNANVDITLAFEPVGQTGIIGDDCACFVPCLSEGGELSVNGSKAVCFEEGTLDPVTFGNAVLTGAAGDNSLWVLTPGSALSVVATDASGPSFDLSGLAEGNYRIWHISYSNDVDINEVLSNPSTVGCWDASNPVTITIAYTPVGGTISTNGLTTVCTGQGIPSAVSAIYNGEMAAYSRWALTDESGTLLALRADNSLFNFDFRTPGVYRIYYVASATTPANLNSSSNINDLGPCASVSNFIEVTAIDCSGSAQLSSLPNPTSGISTVNFSVEDGQKVQLEVYDLSGRQISTLFNQDANAAQNYTMQFDGSGLPNGVYIYRMTTESEVIVDKFMIAR